MGVNGLVPARFLTLVSHLIITIVIFMNLFLLIDKPQVRVKKILDISVDVHWLYKDENVTACLPLDHTSADYDFNTNLLMVGLILTLVFLGIEFVCFLSGISMFMPIQGLISTVAHATAALTLSFFVVDEWECTDFFYIFGFCSTFPMLTECIIFFGVSTFAHAGASIALSYFIVDVWKCYNYYYVFAICSAFPVFTELVVVVGAMVFQV